MSIYTYGAQKLLLQKFGECLVYPLPHCPEYRKFVNAALLDDNDDRLKINAVQDAEKSWKIASSIYLSLPPGEGDPEIEDWLFKQRVKIDRLTSH